MIGNLRMENSTDEISKDSVNEKGEKKTINIDKSV